MPASHVDAETDDKLATEHHFVQIPAGLWRMGWLATLSNNAMATWLALMHWSRSGTNRGVWISPSQVHEQYGISDDTWTRGLKELRDRGLLKVDKQSVGKEFMFERVRNKYTLRLKRLDRPPHWRDDQ